MDPVSVIRVTKDSFPELLRFREALGSHRHDELLKGLDVGDMFFWLALDGEGQPCAYSAVMLWQNRPELLSVTLRLEEGRSAEVREAAVTALCRAAVTAKSSEVPLLRGVTSAIADQIPAASLPAMAADGWTPFQEIVSYRKDDVVVPTAATRAAAAAAPGVTVRPFAPSDLAAVLEVEHTAFDPIWWVDAAGFMAPFGPDEEFAVLTARDGPASGGRVVGYNISRWSPPGGFVLKLGVHRDHQGRGYGRFLLAHTLETLHRAGCAHVELTTQFDNRTARGLYESFGFTATSRHWLVKRTVAPNNHGEVRP